MLVVETIGKIRRAYFVQGKPIKAICRELKVSRKVVRKVLRSGATSFEYEREVQPLPKIGPWKADLERILVANAAKPARERLTLMRVFEELRGLGYQGGYDAVRRYARSWHREQAATSAAAFVPLSFAPGEAYQFDWSHEVVLINGTTVIVKVAHVRLCHSPHAVRAGLPARDPGDGLRRPRPGVRLLQGRLHARHLRQSMDASRRKVICWCRRRGMHEFIRPVAGAITLLALMGVRCLWPHNMIGRRGLVVDQASRLRSMPTIHQTPRIRCGGFSLPDARSSCYAAA